MTERPYAMQRTCAECPWRRDVAPGRFPAERFKELEATCRPGGLPGVFACHKSAPGEEQACAGFLLVCGHDNNLVRIAANAGFFDPDSIQAAGPLYASFDEMARANGYDPPPWDEHGRAIVCVRRSE
ncbi:MAG TPA: DUF6283 family protein [Acetobacteraceae bacterium]